MSVPVFGLEFVLLGLKEVDSPGGEDEPALSGLVPVAIILGHRRAVLGRQGIRTAVVKWRVIAASLMSIE